MASFHQRSFAEVGFGFLYGCWNAGPSRRNRRFLENNFRVLHFFVKLEKLEMRCQKKIEIPYFKNL